MSHVLSDVESELLFDKLNRRARLLKSLRRNPLRSPWYLIPFNALFFGLSGVLIALWFASEGSGLVFLAGLVAMLLATTIDLHIVATNSRIDTLVELLQQEGMLQSTLGAWRKERQGGGPTGDTAGTCLGS